MNTLKIKKSIANLSPGEVLELYLSSKGITAKDNDSFLSLVRSLEVLISCYDKEKKNKRNTEIYNGLFL